MFTTAVIHIYVNIYSVDTQRRNVEPLHSWAACTSSTSLWGSDLSSRKLTLAGGRVVCCFLQVFPSVTWMQPCRTNIVWRKASLSCFIFTAEKLFVPLLNDRVKGREKRNPRLSGTVLFSSRTKCLFFWFLSFCF